MILRKGALTPLDLTTTGNLTIAGILTRNSDMDTKENVRRVDSQSILARLKEMPISTWSLKEGEEGVIHLGPMAQDFHSAFGLGDDNRHIAPMDAAGIALAAIQEVVREKDEQIALRDARLMELEKRISLLEEKLLKISLGVAKGELIASNTHDR